MDRAQELRTLMKQGAKGDAAGAALSGKDKAKLLKLMREQQKQKEVAAPVRKAVPSSAPVTSSHQSSGLPAGFFDGAPAAAAISTQVQQTTVAKTSAKPSAAAPATSAAASNVSNLPQGFFDNPVEDLNARGISMEQYTAKMEKEEQAELDSFLTEMKGMEGDRERAEEEIEQQEGATREFEEEAAQMTYMANLIALRVQSEHILTAGKTRAGNVAGERSGHLNGEQNSEENETDAAADAEAQQALQSLLKEAEEVRKASATEPSAANDVDAILYQKLAQEMASKRKRSDILNNILKPSASVTTSSGNAAAVGSEHNGSASASGGNKNSGNSGSDSDSGNGSGSGSDSGSESSDGSDESPVPAKKAKYTPLNFMDWTARTI